jgi:hypothetical protein
MGICNALAKSEKNFDLILRMLMRGQRAEGRGERREERGERREEREPMTLISSIEKMEDECWFTMLDHECSTIE